MPASHILTFAQTLQGGGVERAQLRLARGWIAAGRRVTLVIGTVLGPLAAEIPAGLEIVELGSPAYRAMAALPGHVRRLAPDLIFCPGNHYTGVAGWIRWRLGADCPPIVAKVSNALVRHDQGFPIAQAYPTWLRMHPRFLDTVVAMSDGMQAEAMLTMGLPAHRVPVIPNPPAMTIPGAAVAVLPEGRFLLGVGRLAPQKRWDRLIDAMLEIDASLVILGEGEERPALEAQVRALGLEHRITLPGYIADPLPAITRATLVALTSDYEGVPGVLREALAAGTPVVATDASVAVREIVTAPEQGTVVPRGDAAALVAALRYWMASEARPTPLIAHGPDPAMAYLAVFDRLVAQRSGSAN